MLVSAYSRLEGDTQQVSGVLHQCSSLFSHSLSPDSLLLDAWPPSFVFLSRGEPLGSAWASKLPHTVSGQCRAHLTGFLSLLVSNYHGLLGSVLGAFCLYSLSSFLIIPGRKVSPMYAPPQLEAGVSPHCGFNFPFCNHQRFSSFSHVESSDLVDDLLSKLSVHLALFFPLGYRCLFLVT